MPDRCEHCERDICQPADVQELIDAARFVVAGFDEEKKWPINSRRFINAHVQLASLVRHLSGSIDEYETEGVTMKATIEFDTELTQEELITKLGAVGVFTGLEALGAYPVVTVEETDV